MKRSLLTLVVLALVPPSALADVREDGLLLVGELGQANGTALACRQSDNAARIKRLAIELTPKTREWGERFEKATNDGFLTQHQAGASCPAADALATDVDRIEARLRAVMGRS